MAQPTDSAPAALTQPQPPPKPPSGFWTVPHHPNCAHQRFQVCLAPYECTLCPYEIQMQVISRMRPMVGNRLTMAYTGSPSHTVLADDQRLYQAVHVVLANSFKYTRRVSTHPRTYRMHLEMLCIEGSNCLVHAIGSGRLHYRLDRDHANRNLHLPTLRCDHVTAWPLTLCCPPPYGIRGNTWL